MMKVKKKLYCNESIAKRDTKHEIKHSIEPFQIFNEVVFSVKNNCIRSFFITIVLKYYFWTTWKIYITQHVIIVYILHTSSEY
jgi:hypothetical protein